LSSALPMGKDPSQVGMGEPLKVDIGNLLPFQTYDLAMQVRYTRLGSRKWSKGLDFAVVTKKPVEDRFAVEIRAVIPSGTGGASMRTADTRKIITVPLENGHRVDLDMKSLVKEPHRVATQSPRRLAPLDGAPRDSSSPVDPAHQTPRDLVANDFDKHPQVAPPPRDPAAVSANEFEEWAALAQADTERVTGGAIQHALGVGLGDPQPPPAAGGVPGYPPRPPDFVPFWRRDPMDSRPSMPRMPQGDHSAMQIDLMGRAQRTPRGPAVSNESTTPRCLGGGTTPVVPQPPNSDRVMQSGRFGRSPGERSTYPRRLT